ncbi:MAG: O-antigen ligase family protein [Planctomycetota bacterium]
MTGDATASPGAVSGRSEPGFALAAFLALLALPFVPAWLDFELARRGMLMALVGLVLLGFALRRRVLRSAAPHGTVPCVVLVVWLLCGMPGSTGHVDQGLQRVLYLGGLAALFVAGARWQVDTVLRAVVSIGVLVAAYGTAQALGLDLPAGYARPDQPVSTFGNTNAASEFTTFALAAAMALAVRTRRAAAFMVPTILVLGLYVGANGTRAGYVGVGLACVLLALADRRIASRAMVAAVAALAVVVGAGLHGGRQPDPPAPAAMEAPAAVTPSTIDVRFALWSGTLDLIAEAPLAGHGPGQFRTEYPRFRTQREIEATSFGRQFATFAENPHNEFLELAAEGGIVAAGLVLLLAWAIGRAGARRGRALLTDLAPVAAFAFACTVRAPLQNAPAAAAAALLAGALAARAPGVTAPRRLAVPRRAGLLTLGALLLYEGSVHVVAATLATHVHDPAALEVAARLHPGESRYRSLLIQARCGGVDASGLLVDHGADALAACRQDLALLLASDPNNTNALFLAAQLGLGGGDAHTARAALGRILELDRSEPRAQSLTAVLLAREGDVPAAIATLYSHPHATLRARLAEVLTELRTIPGLATSADELLARETRFVRAVDALLDDPATGATAQSILAVAGSGDPRGSILVAARLRALGQGQQADALAPEPGSLGPIDTGSLHLMGPLLGPLRSLPRWARVLPEAH